MPRSGSRNKDRAKFVELAEKRVTRAIKDLRLISNLSNRSNYSYSEEDVQKFDVKAGKTIVGREKAHLVLKSKKISRRHGLFVTREARVFFVDNDSHNGSRINGGEDLLPKKAYALSDQDVIEFGDVKYLVRVRGPVEESDDAGESDPIEPTRRA